MREISGLALELDGEVLPSFAGSTVQAVHEASTLATMPAGPALLGAVLRRDRRRA
jgi:hypothetical protein